MNGHAIVFTEVPPAFGAEAAGPGPGGVRPDGAASPGRPRIPLMRIWRYAMLCDVDTRARPSNVAAGRPP